MNYDIMHYEITEFVKQSWILGFFEIFENTMLYNSNTSYLTCRFSLDKLLYKMRFFFLNVRQNITK